MGRVKNLLTETHTNDDRGNNFSAELRDMYIEGDHKKSLKEYLGNTYDISSLDGEKINKISEVIGMEAKIILINLAIDNLKIDIDNPF